jgi:hypothetical protein
MADTGFSDLEALDGFHGSEKVYLSLLLKIASRDARLQAAMKSQSELQGLLDRATGRFAVYPTGRHRE